MKATPEHETFVRLTVFLVRCVLAVGNALLYFSATALCASAFSLLHALASQAGDELALPSPVMAAHPEWLLNTVIQAPLTAGWVLSVIPQAPSILTVAITTLTAVAVATFTWRQTRDRLEDLTTWVRNETDN